jgi:hypothetical protein
MVILRTHCTTWLAALIWIGTSEIMAVANVALLRRCPTSAESVPHFTGILNTIGHAHFIAGLFGLAALIGFDNRLPL